MSHTVITSLPTADAFDASVSDLVAAWNASADRVRGLQADQLTARDALSAAKAKDVEALRDAVLAGRTVPPERKFEGPAAEKLAGVTRALPIAITERDRVGRELVFAVRATSRDALVAHASETVGVALAKYRSALDDAARTIAEAESEVAASAGVIPFIEAVDRGLAKAGVGRIPVRPVVFAEAHRSAAEIEKRLDDLGTPELPLTRRIRFDDGTPDGVVTNVHAAGAANHARDGLVLEWLDGAPPQPPSYSYASHKVSTPRRAR